MTVTDSVSRSQWIHTRLTVALGLLAAFLLLVVTWLAIEGSQANRDKNSALDAAHDMQTNASNLAETNQSLQTENRRLTDENSRLKTQSFGAGAVTEPTAPKSSSGTILAAYAVTLGNGNGFTMDVKPPGPYDITPNANAELFYHSQFTSVYDIAMVSSNSTPSLEQCRAQTSFVRTTPPAEKGMSFCVYKKNGAIVGVTVLSVQPGPNIVTVGLTMWQS